MNLPYESSRRIGVQDFLADGSFVDTSWNGGRDVRVREKGKIVFNLPVAFRFIVRSPFLSFLRKICFRSFCPFQSSALSELLNSLDG